MQKFKNITEGMKVVDISKDEGGYNYYGYLRHNGEWVIMREATNQLQYRYKVGADAYSTAWTARTSQSYNLPTLS